MNVAKRVIALLGYDSDKRKEKVPKNIDEVIGALPLEYKAYIVREDKYLTASTVCLVVLCTVFGIFAFRSVQTFRAPMRNIPDDMRDINLTTTVHLVPTTSAIEALLPDIIKAVRDRLYENDPPAALKIKWIIRPQPRQSLEDLHAETSGPLDVYVALVPADKWQHFSVNYAYFAKSSWTLVQTSEDTSKTGHRIGAVIWDVLVDVPHLDVIFKRDQREKVSGLQIAAMPLSHQKRLVWDSVALAADYHIQLVLVHDNDATTTKHAAEVIDLTDNLRRFASRISEVTTLQISSEHLWDFEFSHFLERDVQNRLTLTASALQNIIQEVDASLETIESASPALKLVVLESLQPVVFLDATGEDQRAAVIASWGAVVARDGQSPARLLSALRVLLGIDSQLEGGRVREPHPLSEWEVKRLHIRAWVDNILRTRSAIRALHRMKDGNPDLVISDEVAGYVEYALKRLEQINVEPGRLQLSLAIDARRKAEAALSHPSLLELLYFPQDQKIAALLPILAPLALPLTGSVWKLMKRGFVPCFATVLFLSCSYYFCTGKLLILTLAQSVHHLLSSLFV